MQRLVFAPLELHSVELATAPGDLDRLAWGNPDHHHSGWVYHGLLTGTAAGAVRFLDGLMSGRLPPPELLAIMRIQHPLGGALPGRPWQSTSYGLGPMIGRMSAAGQTIAAIGHSGGGPDSVNALYHFPECRPPCTIAAFTRGRDEGIAEAAVARLAGES